MFSEPTTGSGKRSLSYGEYGNEKVAEWRSFVTFCFGHLVSVSSGKEKRHGVASIKAVPLEELARGHCLAVKNAYRLIKDGEVLLNDGRYLSAINLFRLASEELAKAHMITNAAVFEESDQKGWGWFWRSFTDHREKLKILEHELHRGSYEDKDEFHRRITLLRQQRENALYVELDPTSKKFLPAGSMLESEKDFAELEYKFICGMIKFFMPTGLPTQEVMLQVYKHRRGDTLQRSE